MLFNYIPAIISGKRAARTSSSLSFERDCSCSYVGYVFPVSCASPVMNQNRSL